MADDAAGDTMNTASRMESTCPPGLVQVSKSTWNLLRESDERIMDNPNGSGRGPSALVITEESDWCPTGGVEVKGKGMLETYLWTPPESFLQSLCNPAAFAKIVEVKKKKDPSRTPLTTSLVNSVRNSKPLKATQCQPLKATAHVGVENTSSSLRLPDSCSNAAGGLVFPTSSQAGYGEFHHAASMDMINSGSHARSNNLGISAALLQMCRLSVQGGSGGSMYGSERGLAMDGSLLPAMGSAMGSHYSGNLSARSNVLRGSPIQRRSIVAGPSGLQPLEEEGLIERQGSKDSDEEMLQHLQLDFERFST